MNKNSTPIDSKSKDLYHHFVARLLYLEKYAWPDILTEIAFITMRIKDPHYDYQKKLVRLMKYLQATKDYPLTMESDG